MADSVSKAESQILSMLLAGDHETLATLREQVRHSGVRDREFTGAGFFVHLEVPTGTSRLSRESAFTISDVAGQVSGVDVGFILFVRHGAVDCLECHTWADGEILQAWQLEGLHSVRNDPPGSGTLVRADVRDESALELEATG